MVLPGARTDPRTPGGMPDSGTVNPGGPMPSMPKMGPGPGPTAPGVPDPAKIEELFDQYTSGQITRQDLISQLATFSEGQGGILGLLEGMQEQPDQGMPGMQPQQPTQPGQPMQGMQPGQPPQSGALPGSPQGPGAGGDPMIAPGAAKTPIPSLTEPLDARHQQISLMLQGFGLGPADADQMSTLLNPQPYVYESEKIGTGKKATDDLTWSEDDKVWLDAAGNIGYDPSARRALGGKSLGETLPTYDIDPSTGKAYTGEFVGTQADRFNLQAGMGEHAGDVAAGYVDGELYGETKLVDETSRQARMDRMASLNMPGQITGYSQVDYDAAAVAKQMEDARERERVSQTQPELGGFEASRTQGLWTDPVTNKTYYNGREVTRGDIGVTKESMAEAEEKAERERKAIEFERQKKEQEEKERLEREQQEKDYDEWLASMPAEGGAFHGWAGGEFDPRMYGAMAGTRGAGLGAVAVGLRGKPQPFEDPDKDGVWFPNEKSYNEYKAWSAEGGEGRLYGDPGIEPEFSHWENEAGARVDPGTEGAIGVAKGAIRINMTWPRAGNLGLGKESYHISTYGMTNNDIATLKMNMLSSYWIPWDKDGNPTSGSAAYQKGWEPGKGILWKEYQALGVKQPPAIKPLDTKSKVYKPGDELPEGWTFVDDPSGLGGPVLLDADRKFVGGIDPKTGGVNINPGNQSDTQETNRANASGWLKDYVAPGDQPVVEEVTGDLGFDPNAPKDPWMTDLDLYGEDYPIFQEFVSNLEAGALSSDTFMTQITEVIGDLEMMTAKGDQAGAKRTADALAAEIVATAAATKEELDRDLQAGAAIIAGKATLAAQMEDTANAFKAAAAAGVVPVWEEGQMLRTPGKTPGSYIFKQAPGKWVVPQPDEAGELPAGAQSLEAQRVGLEGERVDIEGRVVGEQEAAGKVTETDKIRQRELDFSQVFGEYIRLTEGTDVAGTAGTLGRGVDPEARMETLEKQKFGLTLALAKAEQTGVFDISAPGTGEAQADLIAGLPVNDQEWLNRFFTQGNPEDLSEGWVAANLSTEGKRVQKQIQAGINAGTGITGVQTLAAKRLAFEIDMSNRAADNVDRLASIAEENNLNQTQLSQNRLNMEGFIAGGQLAEAVEARKDATWLAAEGLRIQREKMKLDTLQSLNDPATYLFAVRYGLLEQIGSVLGIDWGDDVITNDQLPTMVAPGTFPSRQEFENATQIDQRIMLAEYASSQGFTIEQAGLTILGGTPGGRAIRRPSVLGAAR